MSVPRVEWFMASRKKQLDLEAWKAHLEDIGSRLKLGSLSEAEADAARLALLSQTPSPRWRHFRNQRRSAATLIVPAAAFLLIVGIGAATSYVKGPPDAVGAGDANAVSSSHVDPDSDVLARLTDYTQSLDKEAPASGGADGKLLPDVNTMIEGLAARLATSPQDVKGWRMLGWSYFNVGQFDLAAAALAKAVELDPSSDELKRLYEDAKAKSVASTNIANGSSTSPDANGKSDVDPTGDTVAQSDAMAPPQQADAAIRSMVDGLADRLESSPRDVDGWARLMRSRVVLGERDLAAAAFRKSLDVFKDDSAASSKITAAANDLGLKAE